MDICCSCKSTGIKRCVKCDTLVKSLCKCENDKPYIVLTDKIKKILICLVCYNNFEN